MEKKAWQGFAKGKWCEEIDVRDFIQRNYTPYEGDGAFWRRLPRRRKSFGNRSWN